MHHLTPVFGATVHHTKIVVVQTYFFAPPENRKNREIVLTIIIYCSCNVIKNHTHVVFELRKQSYLPKYLISIELIIITLCNRVNLKIKLLR